MGNYADNLKRKKAEQANDQKYFDAEDFAEAISDALKPGGAIATWADGRYEAKNV